MIRRTTVLAGGALVALASLAPPAACAQSSDPWRFGAQIYVFLPSLGKTNFPASGGSPSVEVDADKLIDSLKFVFMGSFEAKKGRWGAFTDVMYLAT